MKTKEIKVKGHNIFIFSKENQDYISLTDMLKAKDGEFFISDWLRNRNTLEFLGIWERINNPYFNWGEFAIIKSQSGLNSYKISVKEWINKTNAIGLKATAGRYGGTYAHKDIAFEFGTWISPEFKLYLIKEFQRLKDAENKLYSLDWNVKRQLTKINYLIHTDAIKKNLIPRVISKNQVQRIYSSEADILNVALFGMTAIDWKINNPSLKGNIRDYSDVIQLIVLANLEVINAELIMQGLSQEKRLVKLNSIAISQSKLFLEHHIVEKINSKYETK